MVCSSSLGLRQFCSLRSEYFRIRIMPWVLNMNFRFGLLFQVQIFWLINRISLKNVFSVEGCPFNSLVPDLLTFWPSDLWSVTKVYISTGAHTMLYRYEIAPGRFLKNPRFKLALYQFAPSYLGANCELAAVVVVMAGVDYLEISARHRGRTYNGNIQLRWVDDSGPLSSTSPRRGRKWASQIISLTLGFDRKAPPRRKTGGQGPQSPRDQSTCLPPVELI